VRYMDRKRAPTPTRPPTAPRLCLTTPQAIAICVTAAVAAVACAGLCAAAILVPAPTAIVPIVAVCCVVCPMMAAWQLPPAVTFFRTRRARHRAAALAELRRGLDQLPETDHPLGL
jgi:hypothetical protein